MKVLTTVIFAIVVTIIQAATTVPERKDVSDDKQASKALATKEYKLEYYAQANWHNAWLACLSCGMKLATITSQGEQDDVQKLISEYGLTQNNIWIAGTDLASEGRFNWFTSGEIFQYTNWGANEPNNNNGTEHCVEIRGSHAQTWNDKLCSTLNYYLCEKSFGCN